MRPHTTQTAGETTHHEALPLDDAERAAILHRIGGMIRAGDRPAIRTKIGSMIWAATTIDEDAAGELADRILAYVERTLCAQERR
ncbi:MAG TPA: hypothetical protein VES19_16450 [Candidatus Limnocylindrales bacterium]|nr:hypothetical protein [Candidatus Limnocylindrales bacterium]